MWVINFRWMWVPYYNNSNNSLTLLGLTFSLSLPLHQPQSGNVSLSEPCLCHGRDSTVLSGMLMVVEGCFFVKIFNLYFFNCFKIEVFWWRKFSFPSPCH